MDGETSERVSRSTIGDTLTVQHAALGIPQLTLQLELTIGRHLSEPTPYEFGSIGALTADSAGNVFVYDSPSREIRQFDRDGRFVRVIGRSGGGPGEHRRVGAMTVVAGYLVLSDPWSGRLVYFDATGEPVSQSRHMFGAIPMRNAYVQSDVKGRIVLPLDAFGAMSLRADSSRQAFVRKPLNGVEYGDEPADTVFIPRRVLQECPVQPERRFRSGFLEDIREPYVLKATWGVTPEGEVVVGCPATYRFDIHRTNGQIVRVESQRWARVPVSRTELDSHLERWSRSKRLSGMDAGFSWDNAQLVDSKPAFGHFLQDHSSRIWAWIPQLSVEVPTSSGTGTMWLEPPGAHFDIFELSGDYLGRVRLPDNVPFEPNPRTVPPTVRGDTLWSVTRDSLGVERVARFRLIHHGAR